MKSLLNSAVVGCGAIHIAHINGILNCGYAKLQAVCDQDETLARKVSEQHNCKYYISYQDLLKDDSIDVIHLCTPHYLHSPMAIQALQAGKHVLCEKPMALTVEECKEMEQASIKAHKYLGISLQNRYNPTTRYILELLASKRFGGLLGGRAFVTWNRDAEYYTKSPWRGKLATEGGGCLVNQSIHTLDLLQLFCTNDGNEIESVAGTVSTKRHSEIIEVEDTADACLFFKNGSRALFYASNAYVSDAPVSIELTCEHGIINMFGSIVTLNSDNGVETVNFNDTNSTGKRYWGSGHDALIDDFYSCIDNRKDFAVGPGQAMRVIKIIETIYKSSSNGSLPQLL